jgi:dihydroneopterin triphosphate diphosphatase
MQNIKLPIRFEAIPFVKKGSTFKFLLVKRVPRDGGFWQPITGTLEANESLFECLYREMEEEVLIVNTEIKNVTDMFYTFTWQKGNTVITEYVFGVELLTERKVKLSDEHEDQKWCSFDQAIKLLEKENNKNAFKEFKKKFM